MGMTSTFDKAKDHSSNEDDGQETTSCAESSAFVALSSPATGSLSVDTFTAKQCTSLLNSRSMNQILRDETRGSGPSLASHSPLALSLKKPSEVFRTDFIAGMKISESQSLPNGNYIELKDTWRTEWEKGVQVPVNPDLLPDIKIRIKNSSEFLSKRRQSFQLPESRITFDSPVDAVMRDQTGISSNYDLDEIDTEWIMSLADLKQRKNEIDEITMERAITYFERKCFENMVHAVTTKEGLSIEYDESTICDVCLSPDTEEGNEIVFCDACNMCAHQVCYGLLEIPEGNWLCRPCSRGILSPPCVLCPNRGGALKRVKDSYDWVHVICAWWIPEVKIEDTDNIENVTVNKIPQSRWNLTCSLCREKMGACVQCSVKRCVRAYHITCAVKEGLEMKTVVIPDKDDVLHTSYCDKHCIPQPSSEKRTKGELVENQRLDELKKLETEFYKLVTIKQASRDLHLSREAIRKLYCYWTLKRKANDNVPLIALTAEQKEQLSGKQGIIFIHEQMNMEAARFTILRQDLERLRNLCYMIVKREKARRELHRSSYEVFYKQHDILTKEDVQPEDEEWICKGNEFMHFVGFRHYTTKSEYESKLGISNADGEESKAESSNATDSSLPGETSESDRGELPTTKGLWSMSGISLPSLDINTEDNGLHRVSFDRNGLLRSLHPDGLLTLSTTIAPPEKKKRRRRASRYAYNPPKKRKKPNPKPHSGLIPSSDVSANDSEDVTSSAISGIDTTSDIATDGESSEIKVSNEESKQDSDGSLPSDKFVDLEQVPDAMRNGVKGSDTFDREVVTGMDDSFHELTTDPGSNSIDGLKSGKVNEEQATIANGVLLSEEINDNYIQATHLNDKGDATTESASNAAKVLQDSENIPKETSETCELSKRANGPSSGDLSSVDYSTESENLDMNLPKAIESGYRKRTQSTIRPFKSHRTSNSKSPKEEKLSTQLNNYRRLSPRLNKFTSPRIPETESNQLVDKLKSGENHVITFEDFERPQRITRSRKSLLNAIEGTART